MDLNLGIRTRGRAAKPVVAAELRRLEASDIALLATEKGVKAPSITKLRDSHHALARCLASGLRPAEASIVTGYSNSRISILQADPTFAELVEFYRSVETEALADLQRRMATMALDALQELHDRLLEDPEKISSSMLLEVIKTMADRTGNGPSSKSTQVSINVNLAERLEAARRRAGLIEGIALPQTPSINEEPVT